MSKKRILRLGGTAVTLLLLSILLVFAFTSCTTTAGSDTILSKEDLEENVTRGATSNNDFVWQYLDEWEFPTFISSKFRSVEVTFRDHFYKELPDALTHAKQTAELFLSEHYDVIELTSEDAVTDALITSYVNSLGDKYSIYRTKDEYTGYTTNLSGKFVGIGVNVRESDDKTGIYVVSIVEGGGAEEAGIVSGDLIVSVNGVSVSEVGYQESVNAITGDEGTSVTLGVKRGEQSLTFTIVRKKIEQKSVTYSLENGIGYIRISSFKANTDEQFIDAVDYMEANGAKGIVYDLRNNTGGYLSSVVNALDYIAPKGTTLASFSNDYDKDRVAKDGHSFLLPSVVLCNGMTASAGELFTAGIRDFADMGLMKATLVGVNTLGKGIMQTTYTLSDGSALTVTVAYYNPPSGKNYHIDGIAPDIEIQPAQGSDTQLDAAMTEIQNLINNN